MTKISFLLATKRSWKEYGSCVIDSISALNIPKYEILVASPNDPNDNRVKWFSDVSDDPNKGIGGDGQFNNLARWSNGDYIAGIVDYQLLPANYLDVFDFLEGPFFKNRKYKITSPATNNQNIYPHPELTPTLPDILHKTPFFTNIPDFPIICHPVMSKESYDQLGYFFHPHLRYMSDWWLLFAVKYKGLPG